MALNPVTNFREKRRAFARRRTEIENLIYGTRPVSGTLLIEAQKLSAEATKISQRLDQVESVIRSAERAVNLTEGSGLGILPAIPIVIVTAVGGVVYLIGKFMDKSSEFLARSSYVTKRTAEGASIAVASAEFARDNPQAAGLFGDMGKLIWPLALGAGFLFFATRRTKR